MACFYSLCKRVLILFPVVLLCAFESNCQTPIPGHVAGVANGSGGALLNQPKSVFISGNYAFVASFGSNALEILDITDPTAPQHESSLTVNGANSVFVSGNYAYLTCGGGFDELQIIDVSDPSSPSLAGSIADG